MTNVQEINQKVQEQTLDIVKKTQDATVDAVTSLTETANKMTMQLPDFANNYEIPGMVEFTKQFPSAAEIIDSNFDFVGQLLANQREFAHRIIAATTPAAK